MECFRTGDVGGGSDCDCTCDPSEQLDVSDQIESWKHQRDGGVSLFLFSHDAGQYFAQMFRGSADLRR